MVECSGRASLFELATQMVRPRGTIVLAGLAGASERVNHDPICLNELQIIGSAGGGSIAEALNLLMRREVDAVLWRSKCKCSAINLPLRKRYTRSDANDAARFRVKSMRRTP